MSEKTSDPRAAEGDVRSVTAVDGVGLDYEVLGEGPPVALLHGAFVGRRAFSRQTRVLAERHRLILPSSRGHDGTDVTLPPDYGFATSEISDLAAVLDAVGADRVHLVGHSSGGAAAFAFARRYPERVDRMVLIEPTLLALLPPAVFDSVATAASSIIDLGDREGGVAALDATFAYMGGDAWQGLDPASRSSRLAPLARMAPMVAPHWRALLDYVVTPGDLAALSPPTLLIYGEKSVEFEASIAACWRAYRPDLALIEVEGAGHNIHRERPDIVNPAMVDHLGGAGSLAADLSP